MKKISLITILTTACMLSATVSIVGINNYVFADDSTNAGVEEEEGWITHETLHKVEPEAHAAMASLFPEGTRIHGIKYKKKRGDSISEYEIHYSHKLKNGTFANRIATLKRESPGWLGLFMSKSAKWVDSTTNMGYPTKSQQKDGFSSRKEPNHHFEYTSEGIKPRYPSSSSGTQQGPGRTGDEFFSQPKSISKDTTSIIGAQNAGSSGSTNSSSTSSKGSTNSSSTSSKGSLSAVKLKKSDSTLRAKHHQELKQKEAQKSNSWFERWFGSDDKEDEEE